MRNRGGKKRGLMKMLNARKEIDKCERHRTKPSMKTRKVISNVTNMKLKGCRQSASSITR